MLAREWLQGFCQDRLTLLVIEAAVCIYRKPRGEPTEGTSPSRVLCSRGICWNAGAPRREKMAARLEKSWMPGVKIASEEGARWALAFDWAVACGALGLPGIRFRH